MDNDLIDKEKKQFARIADGDQIAFTEFFHTYSVKLAPYVAHLINSDTWAEEIVQEVFLKLWKNRKTLKDIENPSAYLYKMASNKSLDYMKHKALEVKLHYHIARKAENEPKNFTEEIIDFRISEKLFREAVNSLPPQRFKVYKLRHEEGYNFDEISEKMKISRNTVRKHLELAMDNIRSYLLKHHGLIILIALLDSWTE